MCNLRKYIFIIITSKKILAQDQNICISTYFGLRNTLSRISNRLYDEHCTECNQIFVQHVGMHLTGHVEYRRLCRISLVIKSSEIKIIIRYYQTVKELNFTHSLSLLKHFKRFLVCSLWLLCRHSIEYKYRTLICCILHKRANEIHTPLIMAIIYEQ